MIWTINFNDKTDIWNQKIHDIITNDMLAKNLNVQLLSSDMIPKHLFRQCRILPVFQCKSF